MCCLGKNIPGRGDRDTNPEAGTHLGVFKVQEGGWLVGVQ